MTKEIEYTIQNNTIIVNVSTHDAFGECKEDIQSPFKFMKQVLPPNVDPNLNEQVVIKCFIEEQHRARTANSQEGGQQICHTVVDEFIKQNWPDKKLHLIESIHCTQFEQQYKYVIF
jgi:hypothetical protein